MQFYANTLRDVIRKANNHRKDALASLNTGDWRVLVYRELQADNWYAEPNMDEEAIATNDRLLALTAESTDVVDQTEGSA